MVGSVALALAALLLVPTPSAAWTALTGPAPADDPTAPLLAVVALATWALAAWLVAGVALVVAGRTPGAVGRVASAVADRTVPGAVHRAVGVVLGGGLVLGAASGVPASASERVAAPAGAAAAAPAVGPVADPSASGPSGEDLLEPAPRLSLDWPTTPVPPTAAPSPTAAAPTPSARPDRTVSAPSTSLPTPARARTPPGASPDVVVVRPGDSLWALAERDLRRSGGSAPTVRAVAAAWPTWWAANRDVLGDDPDLLRPGTALVRPPA